MSIYEVLILAHLGSTAVLLVVLGVLVAVHDAFQVVRGRTSGTDGPGPRADAPAGGEQPQPAPAHGAARDVLPPTGQGVLRRSS